MAKILNERCIDALASDAGYDLLEELITVFIDEMTHREAQVKQASLLQQYKDLAHSIKGSAMTFGAEALAEIAKEVESGARGGSREVSEQVPVLLQCLAQTRSRYQGYLEQLRSSSA
ncbi:Hpt domain-containing protein [Ferrimonas sediminum]|uniref:Hpt domain-containing protein n=1 Tax=Ferrimonas sediminum TaxID=718193 RepID=A0A1G8S7L6_9GAMM|nr:Hpt domain-containing protein [Ferrimonas sediminum]SDJ25234.1 Hpt domain-containing protein [Ferrimonas sediminum]